MNLTIVIPTWKRVEKLSDCLRSLEQQTMVPEEVLVTARKEDDKTLDFLNSWVKSSKLKISVVLVDRPGVVYAENQAIKRILDSSLTEIVTFMDDDAVALPLWVENIKDFFNTHPDAAALGGPDMIVLEPWTYHDIHVDKIGILTYFGKVIGNHHHRATGVRKVDTLKGVNMSVRREYLHELDKNLQGEDPAKGNGVFWELDLCLNVKKKSGILYFDPNLLIHHNSNHGHFEANHVISSTSHNLVYVLMKHFSWPRRFIFLAYALLIGNSHVRGLLKTTVECIKKKSLSPINNFFYSMKGLFAGLVTWKKSELNLN